MPALPRHLHAQRPILRLSGESKCFKPAAAVRCVRHLIRRRACILRCRLPRLFPRDACASQSIRHAVCTPIGKRPVVNQRRVFQAAALPHACIRPWIHAAFLCPASIRLIIYHGVHVRQVRIQSPARTQKTFNLRLVRTGKHASAGYLLRQRHRIIAHLPGKLHGIRSRLHAHRQARNTRFNVLRQQCRLSQQLGALACARGDQQLLQIDLNIRHRTRHICQFALALHRKAHTQITHAHALRGIYANGQAQQYAEHHRQPGAAASFPHASSFIQQSCGRRCSASPRASRSTWM